MLAPTETTFGGDVGAVRAVESGLRPDAGAAMNTLIILLVTIAVLSATVLTSVGWGRG
jgi:hypothetical protein